MAESELYSRLKKLPLLISQHPRQNNFVWSIIIARIWSHTEQVEHRPETSQMSRQGIRSTPTTHFVDDVGSQELSRKAPRNGVDIVRLRTHHGKDARMAMPAKSSIVPKSFGTTG